MNKAQVTEIVNRINVQKFPIHIVLGVDDDAVMAGLNTPDVNEGPNSQDARGLCPWGFSTVALDFANATEETVLKATETAVLKALQHELHEHMRYKGEILSLIHISEPTRLLSISYAV